jgi:uncharacterized protein
MRSTLLADTSVVYAALNPKERDHAACARAVASAPAVVLPAPVLTETAELALRRRNTRAVDVLLGSVLDETVAVVDLDYQDYARTRHLVRKYADLPLSFVDAAVVAIAERLNAETVATLDRRHFSVVQPLHCEAFTLVP